MDARPARSTPACLQVPARRRRPGHCGGGSWRVVSSGVSYKLRPDAGAGVVDGGTIDGAATMSDNDRCLCLQSTLQPDVQPVSLFVVVVSRSAQQHRLHDSSPRFLHAPLL